MKHKETGGKNTESLAKSRKIRGDFISRFGYVPYSVLKRIANDKAIDYSAKDRAYTKVSHEVLSKKDGLTDKQSQRAFETAYRGVRSSNKGQVMALSRFPQNVGKVLTRFYCPKGGVIYDPFAGHNSRMQLCYELGRNYHGFDVSIQFMKANIRIRQQLYRMWKGTLIPNDCWIKLELKSSHWTGLPAGYADFTITSPPYWDIEWYGDERDQLGRAKTYDEFLCSISEHIKENYRVLKRGAYSCWCINDFRKGGKYYMYHSDIANLGISVGFKIAAIYIIDLGIPAQNAFIQTIERNKVFPKGHEYCVVFKKGG